MWISNLISWKSHVMISLQCSYQFRASLFSIPLSVEIVIVLYTSHGRLINYIVFRFSPLNFATHYIFGFAVACWPLWSQWICILFIYCVWSSHTLWTLPRGSRMEAETKLDRTSAWLHPCCTCRPTFYLVLAQTSLSVGIVSRLKLLI
jgi:hypothetical protein